MLGSLAPLFGVLLGAGLSALIAQAPATRPISRWQPPGHQDRGLPKPDAVWSPYDEGPQHPANRVFAAIWLARLQPAEVAAALPTEHSGASKFFTNGWYFKKRDGRDGDERWFGGDGLQLPRERFTAAESAALIDLLLAIDGELAANLRSRPQSCIWLQNDLLRTARRLLDTDANSELLLPLLRAAERLALPAATLEDASLSTFGLESLTAVEPALAHGRLVELDRRSSRLFDAEHSLLWSRVFVQWPETAEPDLQGYLEAAANKLQPSIPLQTRAVLIQGLVAIDDQGRPRATSIAIDVRLQIFANADPLSVANTTTTHDGIAFRAFWLERQTLRERGANLKLSDFRELADEDQVLFRDYGSLKHTTVAAQCSLCHRRTDTPEQDLAGFPVLRRTSEPKSHIAADTRLRRAEAEFERFLVALRSAVK